MRASYLHCGRNNDHFCVFCVGINILQVFLKQGGCVNFFSVNADLFHRFKSCLMYQMY